MDALPQVLMPRETTHPPTSGAWSLRGGRGPGQAGALSPPASPPRRRILSPARGRLSRRWHPTSGSPRSKSRTPGPHTFYPGRRSTRPRTESVQRAQRPCWAAARGGPGPRPPPARLPAGSRGLRGGDRGAGQARGPRCTAAPARGGAPPPRPPATPPGAATPRHLRQVPRSARPAPTRTSSGPLQPVATPVLLGRGCQTRYIFFVRQMPLKWLLPLGFLRNPLVLLSVCQNLQAAPGSPLQCPPTPLRAPL